MRSRKGFTLIELLAVIAILAILVIIALPNVINMYNKAQKETFLTEARNVCREAERKFLANSISGKNTKVFNSEDSTKLDMNGKKLQYCVVLNNSGKVSDMKVSNGKWVASLNGKAIDELTIEDLEEGNLDGFECVEAATDESCFEYEIIDENTGTLAVSIEDDTKCKAYLKNNISGIPDDIATTLCDGNIYSSDGSLISIQALVEHDSIPEDDYKVAGLNRKYIIVEKVEVIDVNKCKNMYSLLGMEDADSTKICTTNENANNKTLFYYVSDGLIPYHFYDKAGLKVTLRTLSTSVNITGYNTGCGTDVVIPSKINGYDVISIRSDAFRACYKEINSKIYSNRYKVKFLDYKNNDEYNGEKMAIHCNGGRLTSITLPNTLLQIGNYAFANNELSELTIPSSVKYIGSYSFKNNNIKTVTYNGNESDISFGNCPYGGNSDYPERNMYYKK